MSTHNLCFRAKIRKNVYPCTPQFYYINVGCKGVFVTRTWFRDVKRKVRSSIITVIVTVANKIMSKYMNLAIKTITLWCVVCQNKQ